MQKLDDEPPKADSASGAVSQSLEPPQQVNNQVLKTPDAKKSPSQSAPDVGDQDKFEAQKCQGGDSAKSVIRMKKPMPAAQLDHKDENPGSTQTPIDQAKKKDPRLPAVRSSIDNLEQTNQLNKKAKKGTGKTKRSGSDTLNYEKPEKVEHLKHDIEEPSQKFKPSVSQIDDAPKIIKKKVKRVTPPPAPEPETEPDEGPEHEKEGETASEDEGEEEIASGDEGEEETASEDEGEEKTIASEDEGEEKTGSEHDNDVDGDEGDESDDENEGEEEVENASEDGASEDEEDDDDEDERKHGCEEEDQKDDVGKTDVLGKEKKVHDATEIVAIAAEPVKINLDAVAQDAEDVSGEADDAPGQAQHKSDSIAAETKDTLCKAQNAIGSLPKKSEHATEEAANKSSSDSVKGVIGKSVIDVGEVTNDSRGNLGKTMADSHSMAGNSNNDAVELTDAGRVVDRVSQVEELQEQAGIAIKGFTLGMEKSGSVNAHGVQINIQSTKDGVSVTINILGIFQQQQ